MCTCTCGAVSVRARVWLDGAADVRTVYLSRELADQLHAADLIPHLRASVERDRVVLGPVIGILCNPVWDRRGARLKPGMQLPTLEKLVQAAQDEGAAAYVFRVEDVDFQRLCTTAYVKRGPAWTPAIVPLPDVIYDQVISRRIERRQEHRRRRAKLSKMYGDRIFNNGFFDKWQVYEWLSRDPRLRSHIPATARYGRPEDLISFLQRYPVTFVKPVHGSLGLGIIRVSREPDGSLTLAHKRAPAAPQEGRAASPAEAAQIIRRRLQSRPYLLQQGIALAMYRNRPFDIRILLQRDGSGEWRRTKMFARVAGAGDFTSNLSSGGEALPVGRVLEELYPRPADRMRCRRQIARVSRLAADVMEQQAQKRFGELGIDVGVDEGGRVWVIEVNSKPWKTPLTRKGRQDLADLAFRRPIQYALRLARQQR
ncbi:MAG: YheC/YheD family protein [Alicyclobacillus sp.]|nr:YheC/YheD family protein [Alicyclobacillus sp.]